ncbi:MAG TPA: ROK family glucokinase [Phycisphaerae bacterium]|nr:ROK family glucokinase [Phycisphaerae bacterium]
MSTRYFVGIDLGGTNVKAGLVDEQAHVKSKLSIETEADGGVDHVIGRIGQAVELAIRQADVPQSAVTGVGIGSPGSMSHKAGIIISPPNLPGWHNVPLRDRVREVSGLPTVLENDANAAAWGEFWAGAGKDITDMVMFTLGTGVGGGVIIDGRLVRGHFDNGAELGHMIVVPDGEPCGCGQKGCLEAYSSAAATARRAVAAIEAGEASSLKLQIDAGQQIKSQQVEQAARDGDALADRIWDEACYYLATACINMQHFSNPQRVVLAGGMIGAGDFLLDRVRKHAEAMTWHAADDLPEIIFATLGNDAGLIGAAGSAHAAWREGEPT